MSQSISWVNLKDKCELTMPLSWKTLISNYSDTDEEDLCQNHHANKGARILSTDELSSKEIHSILISNIVN